MIIFSVTSTCFTTEGNKCIKFEHFNECVPAEEGKYACPVKIRYYKETGYEWEECSQNCSKECLPGQWKCHEQCIDQSQPCKGVCKPSNNIFLEVSTTFG